MKRWLIRNVIEVAYSLITTYYVARWLVMEAYLERGYKAFGGEYMVIFVTLLGSYKAIHYLFDVLEDFCNERRSRTASELSDKRRAVSGSTRACEDEAGISVPERAQG